MVEQQKKVMSPSSNFVAADSRMPVKATALSGASLEAPQVISEGLPPGLTPGLQFTRVKREAFVETMDALPSTSTTSVPMISKLDNNFSSTAIVEKEVISSSTQSLAAAPIVETAALPQHQTIIEKIPVSETEAKEIMKNESISTTTNKEPAVIPTAKTATPVSSLRYTGIPFDVACYLFAWEDNLHMEIPKVAKRTIKSTAAPALINEPVYARSERHLPGRKRRQRWLFTKEGLIVSEYNPDMVLTCHNDTVTVQSRGAITATASTALGSSLPPTSGLASTNAEANSILLTKATAAPVITTAAPLSLCQQWILKPSTDSNFFYICCAKDPSLAVTIDKSAMVHKGYPLTLKPLGALSTAWSYDPK